MACKKDGKVFEDESWYSATQAKYPLQAEWL